jgi:hypothetical protein
MRSYSYLSTLEGRQKEARLAINGFGDKVILLAFELDRQLNDCARNLQERRRCLNQLLMVYGTVTVFSKLLALNLSPFVGDQRGQSI